MKSKKAVLAVSYPNRIFEDYQVLNDSGCLVLYPKLSINVVTGSKNKETTTSLFFSRRQRSEVMFSLHENPRFGLSAKGEIAPVGRQFQ